MKPFGEVQAAASAIRGRYNKAIAQLKEDDDLTPEAKRKRAADLRDKLQSELLKLRDDWTASKQAELRKRQRAVFAVPAERQDAFRAALASADAVESPGDAAALLAKAFRRGDELGAKALLERALDKGWRNVVRMYTEENPSADEAIGDLIDFQQMTESHDHRFSERVTFSQLAHPPAFDAPLQQQAPG